MVVNVIVVLEVMGDLGIICPRVDGGGWEKEGRESSSLMDPLPERRGCTSR